MSEKIQKAVAKARNRADLYFPGSYLQNGRNHPPLYVGLEKFAGKLNIKYILHSVV